MPLTRSDSVYLAAEHDYQSGFVSRDKSMLPATRFPPMKIEAYSLDHIEDTDKILVFARDIGPFMFYGLHAAAEYIEKNYDRFFYSDSDCRGLIEEMRRGVLPDVVEKYDFYIHNLLEDPCWSWA
jgi:hypothetical protein